MKVNDVFTSIMGEIGPWGQGAFAHFIRLSNCNLKCTYCDTNHEEGSKYTVDDILKTVENLGECPNVLITGGEPLLQREGLMELVDALSGQGYKIAIETNGTLPVTSKDFPDLDCCIMDYKLPSSGMEFPPQDFIFEQLFPTDYIKFVIGSLADYRLAVMKAKQFYDRNKVNIAFAPVYLKFQAKDLMELMINDNLFHYLLNIQTHKFINVP